MSITLVVCAFTRVAEVTVTIRRFIWKIGRKKILMSIAYSGIVQHFVSYFKLHLLSLFSMFWTDFREVFYHSHINTIMVLMSVRPSLHLYSHHGQTIGPIGMKLRRGDLEACGVVYI